jgi:hypothetical protein
VGAARFRLLKQGPRSTLPRHLEPSNLHGLLTVRGAKPGAACPESYVSAISLAPPPRTAQQRPELVSEINVAQPPASLGCATPRARGRVRLHVARCSPDDVRPREVWLTLTRASWDITACQSTARGRPGGRGRAIESMWAAGLARATSLVLRSWPTSDRLFSRSHVDTPLASFPPTWMTPSRLLLVAAKCFLGVVACRG